MADRRADPAVDEGHDERPERIRRRPAPRPAAGSQPYGQRYGSAAGQHGSRRAAPASAADGAPAAAPDELTWGGRPLERAGGRFVALAFLGPLIVMLTKGNESRYVRRQAVESLNFQLSILIYGIVSFVLSSC